MKQSFAFFILGFLLIPIRLEAKDPQIDPKTEVFNALRQLETRTVRIKSETMYKGKGQNVSLTVEFIPPDRTRLLPSSFGNTETIVIGSKGYVKVGQEWQVRNIDPRDGAMKANWITDDLKNFDEREIKKTGSELLGGIPTDVYENTANLSDGKLISKYWISTRDHLVIKIESVRKSTEGETRSKTIKTFEYPSDLKIDPPEKLSP